VPICRNGFSCEYMHSAVSANRSGMDGKPVVYLTTQLRGFRVLISPALGHEIFADI
jgi:hypothetical protein